MNLAKIDLNLLVTLKHLLAEKHVSNAALTLETSQPSVSRSLQKLRLLFDDQLLVRTTNGYELTPKAEELQGQLDSLLRSLDKFIKGRKFEPSESDQVLKIFGLAPGVMEFMPQIIREIRSQAPNMVVEMDTIPKRHFDGLNDGSVHFSITSFEPSSRDQDLYRMVLKQQDYRILMSSSHSLADEVLTPDNLRYAQFGQLSLEGNKSLSIEPRFRELGMLGKSEKLATPVLLSNFNAAASIAEETDIIFHLPTRFAIEAAKGKQLVTREVPELLRAPYREVFLYWHKRYHSDPMCIWVRELFKEIYHIRD